MEIRSLLMGAEIEDQVTVTVPPFIEAPTGQRVFIVNSLHSIL